MSFFLAILTFRKDFVVYQEINAEPTKVTANNFKDKVMIYCSLQTEGLCLGQATCSSAKAAGIRLRDIKMRQTLPVCSIHQLILAASLLTCVSQTVTFLLEDLQGKKCKQIWRGKQENPKPVCWYSSLLVFEEEILLAVYMLVFFQARSTMMLCVWNWLRTFTLIVSAHPYCAQNSHVTSF